MAALRLELEPKPALPVPHGSIAEPAGRRRPSNAGEWLCVNGHVRHLLLQGGQMAVVHHTKHVQQTQRRKHLAHITERKMFQHFQRLSKQKHLGQAER